MRGTIPQRSLVARVMQTTNSFIRRFGTRDAPALLRRGGLMDERDAVAAAEREAAVRKAPGERPPCNQRHPCGRRWRGAATPRRAERTWRSAAKFRTVVTDGTTVLTASSDIPAVGRPCGAFTGMRTHTHAAQPPPLACWVRHGKRRALCMIHAVDAHHPLAPPLASAVRPRFVRSRGAGAKGNAAPLENGVRLKETSQ